MNLNLKEEEKSWLACAIDTDGCMAITKTFKKYKSKNTNYSSSNLYVNPLISFNALKYPCLSKYFGKLIGKKIESRNNGDNVVRLRNKEEILELLHEIYFYLIAKKEQAELLILYCLDNFNRNNRIEKGILYYNKMRELNKKRS